MTKKKFNKIMNQNLPVRYAPCPKCGGTEAEKMSFTWWGGIIGPKILTHVKCKNCQSGYNGKTGKDNTTNIIIYTIVVGVIIFLILFVFLIAIALLVINS
jgi:predicted nucleic-acid-binding Zn-ribbon protein